jgi:hypothetical protein
LAVVFLFPSILILAVEDKLKPEAFATLLGTVLGYLLSEFGKEEERKAKDKGKEHLNGPESTGPAKLTAPSTT